MYRGECTGHSIAWRQLLHLSYALCFFRLFLFGFYILSTCPAALDRSTFSKNSSVADKMTITNLIRAIRYYYYNNFFLLLVFIFARAFLFNKDEEKKKLMKKMYANFVITHMLQ